jgi:signal peptidase I
MNLNLDFAAVLVILTVLTGVLWAADAALLLPRRKKKAAQILAEAGADEAARAKAQARADEALREPHVIEYARSFFPVILIVLLLRSFLVEPFRIPSNSMMPTLLTGDFILVNKFTYGIRLPVLNKKIIEVGAPQRGDVIVFRFPKDPSIDYIKRVIGVPGDHVVYRDKVLYINDRRADQVILGVYAGVGSGSVMTGATQLVEHLDDVKHDILTDSRKNFGDIDIIVPPGQYFAMGDNRDNSNDSRFWGTVPEQNLVGKAFMIWMNFDSANSGVDWSRIGSQIR